MFYPCIPENVDLYMRRKIPKMEIQHLELSCIDGWSAFFLVEWSKNSITTLKLSYIYNDKYERYGFYESSYDSDDSYIFGYHISRNMENLQLLQHENISRNIPKELALINILKFVYGSDLEGKRVIKMIGKGKMIFGSGVWKNLI